MKSNLVKLKNHVISTKESLSQDNCEIQNSLSSKHINNALRSVDLSSTRDRIYTVPIVLWMFLTQILSGNRSCRLTVCNFMALRQSKRLKRASSISNAYIKARQKLPLGIIKHLCKGLASRLSIPQKEEWLWKGLRVLFS